MGRMVSDSHNFWWVDYGDDQVS